MSSGALSRLVILAAALASAVPLSAQEVTQSCTCTCSAARRDGSKLVLGTIKDTACQPCEDSCCDALCAPIIQAENDRRKAKKEAVAAARTAGGEQAAEKVGSTDWSYDAKPQSWKCNKFVFDVLNEAGAKVPKLRGWPPLAGQWADPKVAIPGWAVVDGEPQPGDVVALKRISSDATGHVAVVVAPGRSVGAHYDMVKEGTFGFEPDYTYTFRRYVGAP